MRVLDWFQDLEDFGPYLAKIKDVSKSEYLFVYKDNGDRVPQSITIIVKLNVISMEG